MGAGEGRMTGIGDKVGLGPGNGTGTRPTGSPGGSG